MSSRARAAVRRIQKNEEETVGVESTRRESCPSCEAAAFVNVPERLLVENLELGLFQAAIAGGRQLKGRLVECQRASPILGTDFLPQAARYDD